MHSKSSIGTLREYLDAEVAAMHIAVVPLVGALVVMRQGPPQALTKLIMDALQTRDSLAEVSPAAEAVMRLAAFAQFRDQEFAQEEILAQFALLQALGMVHHLYAATAFLERLATFLEGAFSIPEPPATVAH